MKPSNHPPDDDSHKAVDSTQEQEQSSPYSNSMLEVPTFHFIFFSKVLQPISSKLVPCLYQMRWLLSYPLRIPILPHWIPESKRSSGSSNCVMDMFHTVTLTTLRITIGELLLCAPLIVFFVDSFYTSFVQAKSTPAPIDDGPVDTTGYLVTYVMTLTYLSANKSNSLFTFVLGIPFDRMIWFHHISALVTITMAFFHAYTAFNERSIGRLSAYLVQDKINIFGTIATACMVIMVASSGHSKVLRQYAFQLWLCSHMFLAMFVLVATFIHCGTSPLLFLAVGWWAFDLFVRYCVMISCRYRINSNDVSIRRIGTSKDEIIEISFPKPANFVHNAGQFVQIAIPTISIFEFHPFTISSSPYESNITFHIKRRGDWTKRLVELCDKNNTANDRKPISIWMEGPYGNLSIDINDTQRYQMFLLLCGGIGITPCHSISKQLLHEAANKRPMKHLQMIWSVRDMNLVREISPLSDAAMMDDNSNVQVDVYCTTGKGKDVDIEGESPSLHQKVIYGQRPDLDSIFTNIKQKAITEHGETNIAVIACGPTLFMEDIKRACRTYSQASISLSGCKSNGTDGVYFDLHTEVFEY